ncbi:MAG: DUF494 family protein [Candidatus Wallbacteria bacterium]|nr:DUF494 family protein [Candidatus Wallbacteria bacterium]
MEKLLEIITQILRIIAETEVDPRENKEQVISKLVQAGFDANTAEAALHFFFSSHSFLPRLKEKKVNDPLRVLHPKELKNLTTAAQGLLLDFHVNGYISLSEMEELLEIVQESSEQIDSAEVLELLEQTSGIRDRDNDFIPASLYLN